MAVPSGPGTFESPDFQESTAPWQHGSVPVRSDGSPLDGFEGHQQVTVGPSSPFPQPGSSAWSLGISAHRVRAETTLIAIWDGVQQSAEIASSWGVAADQVAIPQRIGFVGRVLRGEHAAAEPIEPGSEHILGTPASGAALTHAIGVPVQAPAGEKAALCAAFSVRPPGYPDMTLQVVESYARLASFCLLDPGALDALFEDSRRDGLTGCLNYSSARQELIREIGRSARHHLHLSCCFIDLDGFKEVNDSHGHLHGNRVLAEIASSLRAGVRGSDSVGRYGGDEFIAILPETGEDEACALAERLRSRLAEAEPNPGDDPIDVSIGVAEWHPGSSSEDLMEAADLALRAAKAAGGGAVVAESDTHRRDWERSRSKGDLMGDGAVRRSHGRTRMPRDDYEYAVKWLDMGMGLTDEPAAQLREKRKQWKRALELQKERQRQRGSATQGGRQPMIRMSWPKRRRPVFPPATGS